MYNIIATSFCDITVFYDLKFAAQTDNTAMTLTVSVGVKPVLKEAFKETFSRRHQDHRATGHHCAKSYYFIYCSQMILTQMTLHCRYSTCEYFASLANT